MSVDARIVGWGHPALRTPARPVEQFDHALAVQVAQMIEAMRVADGVGLAGPQICLMRRVMVYRSPARPESGATALVNPVLEWTSAETELFPEGCLSLPGVWVDVERPARVRVHASDVHGDPVRVEAEGFEASVLQHEMDHLDGTLILDRLSRPARRAAIATLRHQLR